MFDLIIMWASCLHQLPACSIIYNLIPYHQSNNIFNLYSNHFFLSRNSSVNFLNNIYKYLDNMGPTFAKNQTQSQSYLGCKPQRLPRITGPNFNTSEWFRCNHSYNITEFRNNITGQQIDRYYLKFKDKNQQQIYYECFLQRLHEQYIVNTVHYENIEKSGFCSEYLAVHVYIEHIPIRLSDITDIPFPENFYILKTALLGFQMLYSIIGYFQITQQLICIDKFGAIKVWMNEDLSKNYPEQQQQIPNKNETTMVNQIIQLIQGNTEEQYGVMKITKYIQNNKKNKDIRFNEALEIIDTYVHQYKIKVPDYCESIMEIFKDQSEPSYQQNHSKTYLKGPTKKSDGLDKSQIINDIHIPILPLNQQEKTRRQANNKLTTKKQTKQKHKDNRSKNLTTDRTVPLYPHQYKKVNLTDRSNETHMQALHKNIIPARQAPQLGNYHYLVSDNHHNSYAHNNMKFMIPPNKNTTIGPLNKIITSQLTSSKISYKNIQFTYGQCQPSQFDNINPRNKGREVNNKGKEKYRQIHAINPAEGREVNNKGKYQYRQIHAINPVERQITKGDKSKKPLEKQKIKNNEIMDEIDPEILADIAKFL